jgi:chromosome segregation ATPase
VFDDALDLFKKTMPSPALIQIENGDSRKQALALIQELKTTSRSASLDLISFRSRGKKAGFEKVLKMVEDMIVLLKKEQVDDNDKKEYCDASLNSAEDSKRSLERDVKDAKGSIAESQDAIATLKDEIKALQAGIAALDKSVAEAEEQRKEEHSEYTEVVTNNSQVKQVLEFAKNRLNKFYNPKLYKPPPKRELTEEEKLFVDGGGVLPTEAPLGGIAGTGIGAFAQKQESSGVIRMMDMMINDVNSELQKAELEEKEAQQDYDELLADAKNKKAADNKSVTEKSVALAETEQELQGHKQVLTAKGKEFTTTITTIQDLHKECDFFTKNFEVRQTALSEEVEALGQAKAILSGAKLV